MSNRKKTIILVKVNRQILQIIIYTYMYIIQFTIKLHDIIITYQYLNLVNDMFREGFRHGLYTVYFYIGRIEYYTSPYIWQQMCCNDTLSVYRVMESIGEYPAGRESYNSAYQSIYFISLKRDFIFLHLYYAYRRVGTLPTFCCASIKKVERGKFYHSNISRCKDQRFSRKFSFLYNSNEIFVFKFYITRHESYKYIYTCE